MWGVVLRGTKKRLHNRSLWTQVRDHRQAMRAFPPHCFCPQRSAKRECERHKQLVDSKCKNSSSANSRAVRRSIADVSTSIGAVLGLHMGVCKRAERGF
mmetsp:Transcript_18745/g.31486  ORF Transcript_18745/g.31486 Transcript_18745/m.31486 type:complete len:99 (-) Transcript_18745:660-956(-)